MAAKKPAIQLSGVDDIIRGSVAIGRKVVKRVTKSNKNFIGTQFPKNQSLTPKKFKKVYGK